MQCDRTAGNITGYQRSVRYRRDNSAVPTVFYNTFTVFYSILSAQVCGELGQRAVHHGHSDGVLKTLSVRHAGEAPPACSVGEGPVGDAHSDMKIIFRVLRGKFNMHKNTCFKGELLDTNAAIITCT